MYIYIFMSRTCTSHYHRRNAKIRCVIKMSEVLCTCMKHKHIKISRMHHCVSHVYVTHYYRRAYMTHHHRRVYMTLIIIGVHAKIRCVVDA